MMSHLLAASPALQLQAYVPAAELDTLQQQQQSFIARPCYQTYAAEHQTLILLAKQVRQADASAQLSCMSHDCQHTNCSSGKTGHWCRGGDLHAEVCRACQAAVMGVSSKAGIGVHPPCQIHHSAFTAAFIVL